MAYDDRFYYGQCTIHVTAPEGSTVTIDGNNVHQEGTVEGGVCTFTVPPTRQYVVTVGEESEKLFLGYGKCIKLEF